MSDDEAVLHVTHMKAGSQWVYRVLADAFRGRIVRPLPGSMHVLDYPIVPGLVYPSAYVTRKELADAGVRSQLRGVVVMRDLRDTLVSMYYHYRHTPWSYHDDINLRLIGEIRGRDHDEGMRFLMQERLGDIVAIQLSWLDGEMPIVRYEDLVRDGVGSFGRLLAHCGLRLTDRQCRSLIAPARFAAATGRQPGEEVPTAHNRKGVVGDWRNHLSGSLLEDFKARFDEVLVQTGYERDGGWGAVGALPPPSPDVPLPPDPIPSAERRRRALAEERSVVAAQIQDMLDAVDDVLIEDCVALGAGWHAPERQGDLAFRWAGEDAAIDVARSSGRRKGLAIDVEPGPGVDADAYVLELRDDRDHVLARVKGPGGRAEVELRCSVPRGDAVTLRLRVTPGGRSPPEPEQRILNFRAFGIGLL